MHSTAACRSELFALLACGAAFAPGAHAGTRPPQTLQTVIVTGTRSPDITAADSLKPIDVITSRQLAATGAPDLDTALRTLLPSFNFPQPSQPGATDATLPAQLRGLSPDDTLVLINGKRQHTTAMVNVDGPMVGRGSSPVDLSAIPVNAIERIEVLRDGAAAQYGSAAIAGVINIILKGGARHGSASIGRGVYDDMQGQTWTGGADGGLRLGRRGWVRLAADYEKQDATNHIGPQTEFMVPGEPAFDRIDAHYGLPFKVVRQVAVNAQYRLGDSATAYAFSVFNQRCVDAGGAFNAPSQYASISPAAMAVYPNGFLPVIHSHIHDDSTVLGLRGNVLGWHYDVSASTGGNHVKMFTRHSFNDSLGAASPTDFYDDTLASRQDIFNADFRREIAYGGYQPLNVAWGLAWRHQMFAIKPGAAAAFFGRGAVNGFGFGPGDAGVHVRTDAAEYLDVETRVDRKLSIDGAARHEHYSDFGNATSWSLSARYTVAPTLALRGTASTGLRAPSLQQEYYASTTVEFLNDARGVPIPFTIGTFPTDDPAAVALGAQPLAPETSHNYSLGLVFTPANGAYFTLDAYQITIDHRIILSGDLVGPRVADFLELDGIAGVTGGRFFTNAATTRTRGADFTGRWSVPTGATRVEFLAGLNYNETDILSIRPNPPQLGLAGLVLPVFNRPDQGLVTVATPRTKSFVAANWIVGRWSWHGQLTRYSQWTVFGNTPAADDTYGARVLLDASATYSRNHWAFTLGAHNLANTYPEKNNALNSFDGVIPYPFSSPFGFSGRYVYASAVFHW
ncbi:MAG TPA: TonB-dependent receptor [Rhodanobacteraceae bacterium]